MTTYVIAHQDGRVTEEDGDDLASVAQKYNEFTTTISIKEETQNGQVDDQSAESTAEV